MFSYPFDLSPFEIVISIILSSNFASFLLEFEKGTERVSRYNRLLPAIREWNRYIRAPYHAGTWREFTITRSFNSQNRFQFSFFRSFTIIRYYIFLTFIREVSDLLRTFIFCCLPFGANVISPISRMARIFVSCKNQFCLRVRRLTDGRSGYPGCPDILFKFYCLPKEKKGAQMIQVLEIRDPFIFTV